MISEHFVEAANATSINSPYGVSEWVISGLHPAPSKDVKPSRVKESVFSIEGKLMDTKEFESRVNKGSKTGVMAIIEGVRFWVREDAINGEKNLIDPAVRVPNKVISSGGKDTKEVLGSEAHESARRDHLQSDHRGFRASSTRLQTDD